ncbi:hypothetical protein ACXIVK_36480 [Paraburkholderia caledonica]
MFLPIEIRSVNRQEQLEEGEYHASCRTYASEDGACTMLHFEYKRVEDELAGACEIVFVDPDGGIRACDFLRMPDRSWRDSFGARADSLLPLLPHDAAGYRLLSVSELGVRFVGNAA